jgi:hypothetical protein
MGRVATKASRSGPLCGVVRAHRATFRAEHAARDGTTQLRNVSQLQPYSPGDRLRDKVR